MSNDTSNIREYCFSLLKKNPYLPLEDMESQVKAKFHDIPLDLVEKGLLDTVLIRSYKDTAYFAKVFFPDAFRSPFSKLHYEYFDFIDNADCKRKGIVAPRGFGKTTVTKVVLMKKILFRDKRFVGYLTSSGDVAISVSDSIKSVLTSSRLLRKVFGDVSTSKSEGVKD